MTFSGIFQSWQPKSCRQDRKSSARTLKFLEIFGSINVRTSRFPFVRSEVYSSLFTRTETKINDIWFWFPRNEPRSLKDILNFASTSTFQSSNKGLPDQRLVTRRFFLVYFIQIQPTYIKISYYREYDVQIPHPNTFVALFEHNSDLISKFNQ